MAILDGKETPMRTSALLLAALALGGCAVAPQETESHRFFADALFGPPSEPIEPGKVFAASDEMKRYLATDVGTGIGLKERQRALAEALRSKAHLKLEYDAAFTRNAAEAFHARSGNCLSLVIMTAALAKEMGVRVGFHAVRAEDTWSRAGDIYFSIGHVNVTLGGRPPTLGTRIDDGEQLTIDFLPVHDIRDLKWKPLDESTIVAMYMNNRAAEELAEGNVDEAYWFAREAVLQDPNFVTLYNTLGVVYLRHGHLDKAASVLAYGLQREPRNTILMSNLAIAYARQGRLADSRDLEQRVAQIEPNPPFAYFNRGVMAMKAGNYRAARDLFAKEVDRAPYYHEFHFWLALALAGLGDNDGARQQLFLAIENSTTRKDTDLYAAKLARIRSSQPH
jgi:Flp pilus assembly protein TadD